MKTRCPYCRTPVETPDSHGSWVECPKCRCSFHPRKAREEKPPAEEEDPEEEAGQDGRRGRRRRGKKPFFEDWRDPAGRMRNAKKIAGTILVVLLVGAALYLYVGKPASAALELDFEVDAPESVRVKVTAEKDYRWRRRGADSWQVSLKAVVTNASKQTLSVGNVRVYFYDDDGERIRTRGPATDELLPLDSMGAGISFLDPGKSRAYKTLFPFEFRAGFGTQRVKCVVRMKDVTPFRFGGSSAGEDD